MLSLRLNEPLPDAQRRKISDRMFELIDQKLGRRTFGSC